MYIKKLLRIHEHDYTSGNCTASLFEKEMQKGGGHVINGYDLGVTTKSLPTLTLYVQLSIFFSAPPPSKYIVTKQYRPRITLCFPTPPYPTLSLSTFTFRVALPNDQYIRTY